MPPHTPPTPPSGPQTPNRTLHPPTDPSQPHIKPPDPHRTPRPPIKLLRQRHGTPPQLHITPPTPLQTPPHRPPDPPAAHLEKKESGTQVRVCREVLNLRERRGQRPHSGPIGPHRRVVGGGPGPHAPSAAHIQLHHLRPPRHGSLHGRRCGRSASGFRLRSLGFRFLPTLLLIGLPAPDGPAIGGTRLVRAYLPLCALIGE